MNPVAPRVVIEGVDPEIDGGLYPIKRTVGEEVEIRADAYADGHDALVVVLRYRQGGSSDWNETPMTALGNDRWKARFRVLELGRYEYTLQAWIDRFATWRKELSKKAEAGQDVASELLEGAELLNRTARKASTADAHWIRERAVVIGWKSDQSIRVQTALDPTLAEVMARNADRTLGAVYELSLI